MAASAAASQQSQGTAKQAAQPGQAEHLIQVGLEAPPNSSPVPLRQVDSALHGQAAMQPCPPQERSSEAEGSQKTRLAVAVKEESVRGSPEWKVRGTKEAEAQRTGNTLFAEVCQPGQPLGPTAMPPAVLLNAVSGCPDPSFLPLHPSREALCIHHMMPFAAMLCGLFTCSGDCRVD